MERNDAARGRAPLNVPFAEPATFERNYIRGAVCELRFPILLDVEVKPPTKLGKALRKHYPLYERGSSMNIRPGSGPVETESVHTFKSKSGAWTVTFKASSIA